MSKNRLYQVLLAPRVTEKSTRVGEDGNQYVFHVVKDASKAEVKGAVEELFEVSVESVRIVNVKGKNKSFRMRPGKRSDWKKAYVRVQEGCKDEDSWQSLRQNQHRQDVVVSSRSSMITCTRVLLMLPWWKRRTRMAAATTWAGSRRATRAADTSNTIA